MVNASQVAGYVAKCFFHVYIPWLFPFPKEGFQQLVAGKKRVIDVEMNATGQLAQLIRLKTGIEITEKLLKYDGRPFFPEEIIEKISK